MANYYVDLTAGTGINRDSPPTGTKSKAHFEYISREGRYAKKDDLIKIENKELDKDKFPLGYDPNPNFTKLGYDPKEFWLMSEDKSIVGNQHTSYKDFKISLPSELSNEDNIKLAQQFCEDIFGSRHLYTFVIHAPDFQNNKEKKDNGEKQIHFHVMFSLQEVPVSDYENPVHMKEFLRPYGFTNKKIDGVVTQVQYGHAKKSTYMNSQSERINEETGEKEPKFVKMARKKWEDILNKKLIEKGVEPVSCKTLEEQRKDAILIGDLAKAESLNRSPINLPGWIKLKKNPNERDIEKMKQHYINLEIKEKKLEVYDALKKDFTTERRKDIHVLLDSIDNCTNQIVELTKKKEVQVKKNEVAVLNKVSNGQYYRIRNRLSKEKNAKEIKAINDTLEKIKEDILKDKDKSKQYHTLLKSYNSKSKSTYDNKINVLVKDRNVIQEKFKTLEFYNPETDKIGSLNHEYYKYQQQVKEYNINPTETTKIDVSESLKKFEDLLLKQTKEDLLKAPLENIISLKDDLKVQLHYLKQNPGFLEKMKINKEIKEIEVKIKEQNKEIKVIRKGFENIPSSPDFKKKVSAKNTELIKSGTTKVANKEKERVSNKPISIREFAKKEVKRRTASNSKSEGGFSVDIELEDVEELEKDKGNER